MRCQDVAVTTATTAPICRVDFPALVAGWGLTAGPLALHDLWALVFPALQAGLGKLPGLCPCRLPNVARMRCQDVARLLLVCCSFVARLLLVCFRDVVHMHFRDVFVCVATTLLVCC